MDWFFLQGDTLSKIVRLFQDYDQKQQTLDLCLSNRLDRLNIQCISNDITEENKGKQSTIAFSWFYI